MLKQRIITASILFPIVLLTILYGSTATVDLLTAVILLLAVLEWNKLIGIQQIWLNCLTVIVLSSICLLAKIFASNVFFCCLVATIWWIISLFFVLFYPKGQKFLTQRWVGFSLTIILFVPVWLAIDWLHTIAEIGPLWVIFVCMLIWSADIGAYCTGKLWGKKKLIERISAGKTWVGVSGAFSFAFIVVLLFAKFWLVTQSFIMLMLLGVIVVIAAILGDLVESIFKRICGVKDSGNLLPGHGGILDRIDSLLAAVPIFVVSLNFLQNL